MDDENSNYIDQIQEKQTKFKQEFSAKLGETSQAEKVFQPSNFTIDMPEREVEDHAALSALDNMSLVLTDRLEGTSHVLKDHNKAKLDVKLIKQI